MPDTGDAVVYQIRLNGTIYGEECLNVFYYGGDAVTIDFGALATSFSDEVLVHLFPTVVTRYVVDSIDITGVKGTSLFTNIPLGSTGSVGTDGLPANVTWDFRYTRGGAGERNGYKRFSGVPESLQSDGQATDTAAALLATLSGGLFSGISDGATVYSPVIQRDLIHHVIQHPPLYFNCSSVQFTKIGTQNTRKPGHGR